MEQLTAQQIFDRSFLHLWKQNGQALNDCFCAYRTRDKKMCAVGCLIPDDVYHGDMEGKLAVNLIHFPGISGLFGTDLEFLNDVQKVHDYFRESQTDTFRDYLVFHYRLLADMFDLSVSVIDELENGEEE